MRPDIRGGRGKKLTALAPLLSERGDELEADFQQFYGLDLNALVDGGEWRRAQVLAAQLPAESRVSRALYPQNAWGQAEYLLAYIADNVAFLRYEQGGGKRQKKPKAYPRPERAEAKRPVRPDERTVHGMSAEQVGRILGRPRG